MKLDGIVTMSDATAKMYWSVTATCMYTMPWSTPDILNAVLGLAKHKIAPREAHIRSLMTLKKYMVYTKKGVVFIAE